MGNGIIFEEFVSRGCGLDVHQKTVVATVSGEGIKKQTREFSTFTRSLTELKEWLLELGITHIAMESTGVYWKPVFNILEAGGFTILVVNARHIKYVPGHKTDKKDSAWICKLLLAGLLKGSFVPPIGLRDLRDLTRYRRKVTNQITSEKNRMMKILEDCNIKLSSVLSKVNGVSGTRILDALLGGESDPEELVKLVHGRVQSGREDIKLSVEGHLTKHHKRILAILKRSISQKESIIEELDACITEMLAPFAEEIRLLETIPGVAQKAAGELIAEIGADMDQFPSDKHLCSWAGMSPGNNESAGKKKAGAPHMVINNLKP